MNTFSQRIVSTSSNHASSSSDEEDISYLQREFDGVAEEDSSSGEPESNNSELVLTDSHALSSVNGLTFVEDNKFEGLDNVSRAASLICSMNQGIRQGEIWNPNLTPAQFEKITAAYRTLMGNAPAQIVIVDPAAAFRYMSAGETAAMKWTQDPYEFSFGACDPDIKENSNKLSFVSKETRKPYVYEFVDCSPLNIMVSSGHLKLTLPLTLTPQELYSVAAAMYHKRGENTINCSFGSIIVAFPRSILPHQKTLSHSTFHSLARSYSVLSSKAKPSAMEKIKVDVTINLLKGKCLSTRLSYYTMAIDLCERLVQDYQATPGDVLKIRRWIRNDTVLDKGFCKDVELMVNNGVIQQSVAVKHVGIANAVLEKCRHNGELVVKTVGYVGVMIPSKKTPSPPNLGVAQFYKIMDAAGVKMKFYDLNAPVDGVKVNIIGAEIHVNQANINLTEFKESILVTDCNFIRDKKAVNPSQSLNQQSLKLVASRAKQGKLTVVKLLRDDTTVFGPNQNIKIISEGRKHSGEVFGMTCNRASASSLGWSAENSEADKNRGLKLVLGNGGLATVGRSMPGKQLTPEVEEKDIDFNFDPSVAEACPDGSDGKEAVSH